MRTMTSSLSILPSVGSWRGARVGVLGLGRSGRAAAELLLREACEVELFDDSSAESLAPELQGVIAQARALHGGSAAADPVNLNELDVLVLSPGVPGQHPLVREAESRDMPVISELELATRRIRGPIVLVTGTNGKSTTVSLIHHLLCSAGRGSLLAGNIGTAASSIVGEADETQLVVLEASSFQLERVEAMKPKVAVLLNLAPDHLDRYADFDAYAESKRRMLMNMDSEDFFVFPRGEAMAEVWSAVCSSRQLRFQPSPFTTEDDGSGLVEDWLVRRSGRREDKVLTASALPLLGRHNQLNALAAIAALIPFDLPVEALAEGLRSFRGLPHRVEPVAELAQVRYVDDSKATNVHATVTALEGLEGPIVLLLGGQGKGEDYRPLREAMTKVRAAICYGAEGAALEEALRGAVTLERADVMRDAVDRARGLAQAGDTILLSPACTSFDEFSSFNERGEVFAALARQGGGEQ